MNKNDKSRFEINYQQLLKCLKLQGKADKTIEAYSRAIRRTSEYFDCLPEKLTPDNLKDYFAALVESHSWSTVKIDRLGLQFYWRHVLKKDWRWVDIVKPPKVKTIPDILTPSEIERLLSATRKLRYRVFLLTTYSMGLRLEEALCLQVGDIDAMRKMVHIRRGKGHKDRMLPLPDFTLKALRTLWLKHRHPNLLFPNPVGSAQCIQQATRHMDRGGAQSAMKAVVNDCDIKKKYPYTACAIVMPLTYSNAA
jgi:site-specific recombinase XerD